MVVNLAAQAGVRYSIENPDAYIQSNMIGFYNILEACRHSCDDMKTKTKPNMDGTEYKGVQHLVYASSSSVYGGNKKVPFAVEDRVDNPVSLYAATKKSNELFAHCYTKLYNIPTTLEAEWIANRLEMLYYYAVVNSRRCLYMFFCVRHKSG